MKCIILSFISFLIISTSLNAQVGIGTDTPDSSAMLDVKSSTRGFLPPRIALTSLSSPSPVANPANGLLVYNTDTSGIYPDNVIPGYYYWSEANWYPIASKGNSFGDMQYWDGVKWIIIPIGNEGEKLTVCNGKPVWGDCYKTVTLQPSPNPYETIVNLHIPNLVYTNHPQIIAKAWTSSSQPYNLRSMFKFDYSFLPPEAIVDSAVLYLYADPTPINGNLTEAHSGNANSFVVQRITSNWTLPTTYSWNNQPTTTTLNQVTVPQSNSSFENAVINVSVLVKDQIQNGNNGFFMRLPNEVIYNARQYCSSSHADVSRHPKLVLYYHQ